MISLDPVVLLEEVEDARKQTKKHLKLIQRLVKVYAGNWWREDVKGPATPENMVFTLIATLLPAMIFDNPAVTVDAVESITHEPIAKAQRVIINQWIKRVELRDELEWTALDMLLGYGVMMHGLEERGAFAANPHCGVEERFQIEALTPYLIRQEPSEFFIDAQAKHRSTARILGREIQRDHEDLLQDPRYDRAVIESLTPDPNDPHNGSTRGLRAKATENRRGRITLYELYLPEHRMTCTVVPMDGGKAAFARPPAEYKGPKSGPYVLFGVYGIPGSPLPMSPVAAMAEQFMELNAHATAAAVEAGTHKRLVLTNGTNPDVKAQIHSARSGDVISIPGFTSSDAMDVELGGTSDTRLKYLEQLRQRCDRIAGQSDAARGKASGVTATEATLADANGDTRTEFIHLKFRAGVKAALTAVGWYFFNIEAIAEPVTVDDPNTGQSFEGLFLGGPQPGQEHMRWEDGYFLDIEPHSMRRMDPALQQQRAMERITLVSQIVPLMVQFPFVNWTAILDDLGEAQNVPDYASRILTPAGMAMLGIGGMGMMAGAMAQGGMGGGGPPAIGGPGAGASPAMRAGPTGTPLPSQPSPELTM